jgi:aromatic-L-amino-acid/L-tryptophan decarboxylase
MLTFQKNLRSEPIFKPIPPEIFDYLKQSAPREPLGAEKTYQEFLDKILKHHGSYLQSPKTLAMVLASSTPFAALSDMWMAGLNGIPGNPKMGISANLELQVISWFKEVLGYPKDSSGILGSGGSMANLIGLTVGRNVKAGYNVKEEGIKEKFTFYGSTEMHSSIQRALEQMGIGSKYLVRIPVDDEYRINVSQLKSKVAEDVSKGYKPLCVVGNAGSTNTGSFDDLNALADYCDEEGLWFHVDGAFGAWAALSLKYKHLTDGMERADSLAFDLHKWMFLPFGIGCTLVRDGDAHYFTYSTHADYIAHEDRWLVDYGVELSRPFRALKAWMSIKENGFNKYGRIIEQNIEQTQYLAKLVKASSSLELLAPFPLNVVNFRYVKDGLDVKQLNDLNQRIVDTIRLGGDYFIYSSKIGEKVSLRVCVTNHRTTRRDLEGLVDEIHKVGKALASP